MDIWMYLKSIRRWWWLLLAPPVIAFGFVTFVLFPSAPWQVTWTSVVTFAGNPDKASSFNYADFVVLDDMAHLLESDVIGDLVYLNLPESITDEYSRTDVGDMFSAYRNSRFVQIWVTGDNPAVLEQVAKTTEAVLPDAVNQYLIPADDANYPGKVETVDQITPPKQLTLDRWMKIGALTAAGGGLGLILVGVAEWLRLAHQAKYGAR